MSKDRHILVINAGSSSIKFAVVDTNLDAALHGQISEIGTAPRLLQSAWCALRGA
ncbi:MAG: hypothetical protein AB7U75_21820 [Hyphomicrobiaceae bacterium]